MAHTIDPVEMQPNSPEEQEHFSTTIEDCVSQFKDRTFRGWTGRHYVCMGHFPCGYHMKPLDGVGRWHCISERAIGRTYHER